MLAKLALLYRHLHDQISVDMVWMVGLAIKVAVCVCGHSLHGDVQGAVILPLELGVEEWEGSIYAIPVDQ